MDGLCNFQQAISSRPEIPEDFGRHPHSTSCFYFCSTNEKISYSLGTPGTVVDFIPQKLADFSTVMISLCGASTEIEVCAICRRKYYDDEEDRLQQGYLLATLPYMGRCMQGGFCWGMTGWGRVYNRVLKRVSAFNRWRQRWKKKINRILQSRILPEFSG
jgi:hypothetical protein